MMAIDERSDVVPKGRAQKSCESVAVRGWHDRKKVREERVRMQSPFYDVGEHRERHVGCCGSSQT